MKNFISKFLDHLALAIQTIVLTVAVVFLLTCLIFLLSVIYLTLVLTETLGALIFVVGSTSLVLLLVWAFLRTQRDTFECPNSSINCGQPYACDGCPYNKENE